MALDIKLVQHDAFLEVVVTGTYDMEEAIDRFPHILSACRLTGLSRVLIDHRDLAGIPATTEHILYAFGIQDQYRRHLSTGGQELKVAYVGTPPATDTTGPAVQVARDSDMLFDIFTDIEAAYEWLGVQPA